jgi:hypothetical protein
LVILGIVRDERADARAEFSRYLAESIRLVFGAPRDRGGIGQLPMQALSSSEEDGAHFLRAERNHVIELFVGELRDALGTLFR